MLVREIVLPFVALCLLHLTLSDGKSLGDSQTPVAFALVPEDEPADKNREARQYGFSGGFGGFGGYGGGGQGVYGGGFQDRQHYGHGGGGDYGHGGGYGGDYGHGGGYGQYGHGGGNYGHGGGNYGHGGGNYEHGGGNYGHGGGSYGHGGGGYGNGGGGYGQGGYGGGYGGSEGGYGGDHHHHHGYGRGFLPEFGVEAAPFFAPGAVLQYNQPQPFPSPGSVKGDGGVPPVLLLPQVHPQHLPLPLPHPASPVFSEPPKVVKPVLREELAVLNREEILINRKEEEPEKNVTVKDQEKEECICKQKSQAKEVPKV